MKPKFELKKVFDCQDMPEDIRKIFFDSCGSPSFRGGNDCYVKWYLYAERKPIELVDPAKCSYKDSPNFKLHEYKGGEILKEETTSGVRYVNERGDSPVDDWLYDNGAEWGDQVIIKHWW